MCKYFKGLGLLILIPVLFSCSAELTENQHLEKAQSYIDKGEFRSASIEVKNAVKKNPNNVQARFLLATLHYQLGNPVASEKELERARGLGVSEEAVVPVLANVLLQQRKYDELLSLETNGLPSSVKAEILVTQGYALLGQEKIKKATASFKEATTLDKSSIHVRAANARLKAVNNDFRGAKSAIESVLSDAPEYAFGWSLLGDIELRNQKLEAAEQAYSNAINSSAYNISDAIKRSLIRLQLNKFKEAQFDIDALLKRAPKHAGVFHAQGMLHFLQSNYADAAEAFNQAVLRDKKHVQSLFYLALSHLRLKNLAQAETYGNAVLAVVPRSIQGRIFMATLSFLKKDYARAEEILRPMLVTSSNNVPIMNLLASSLLHQGKVDEAVELLKHIVDIEPDSPIARMRLGVGFLAAGDQQSGITHLKSILESDPEFEQADVLLVLNHLRNKSYDQALAAAQDYQQRNPNSATPLNLQGLAYLSMQRELDARRLFEQAKAIAPGDLTACHNLALIEIKAKKNEKARNLYLEVLRHHPGELSSLLKLAALDGLEKKEQAMVERLQQAIIAHPEAVQPRLVLARHYLVINKPEFVQGLFSELANEKRNTPEVLMILASSQLALQKFADAKIPLDKFIAIQPQSARAHYLLSRAHAGLNNQADSRDELEKAVALDSDFLPAQLEISNVLLREENYEQAKKHIEIVKGLASDHPSVLKLESSLAKLEGDSKIALHQAEMAFKKAPDRESMFFLARLKWSMGDREGSIKLQEQWVKQHPKDSLARHELAGAYLQNGRNGKAIEHYKILLELDNNNLIALNNLAWELRDLEPVQALDYAIRASHINSESAPILDTLALLFLKNGEIEKATRTIRRALDKEPGSLTIQYHSAMIDAKAGREIAARNTLQKLVGNAVAFPEKEEARKLLGELSPKG
ncbi:MAG: XrtA/PEP-CTERM system TPR-repeat protein PrsT [Sedimenticola sp.]